jgi:hypothetical protein
LRFALEVLDGLWWTQVSIEKDRLSLGVAARSSSAGISEMTSFLHRPYAAAGQTEANYVGGIRSILFANLRNMHIVRHVEKILLVHSHNQPQQVLRFDDDWILPMVTRDFTLYCDGTARDYTYLQFVTIWTSVRDVSCHCDQSGSFGSAKGSIRLGVEPSCLITPKEATFRKLLKAAGLQFKGHFHFITRKVKYC